MKASSINLSSLKKVHENKWVAFSPNYKRVVAYNKSLVSLEKEVGKKKVIYMKVPPSGVFFAF